MSTIVAYHEGQLDESVYNNPTADTREADAQGRLQSLSVMVVPVTAYQQNCSIAVTKLPERSRLLIPVVTSNASKRRSNNSAAPSKRSC